MAVPQTTLHDVRHFFGSPKDVTGEYFTHLNYEGSEFSKALNNSSNVDSIETHPIFQLLLSQNYTNADASTDYYIHENIIDLIVNTAIFHKLIDTEDAKTNGIVRGTWPYFLLTTVYSQWENLTDDARKFYSTHLHLLVKSPVGWSKPTDSGVIAAAALNTPENVRLNLTKVDPNDRTSQILFATTLPLIPRSVKGFKITASDAVVEIIHFNPSEDNSEKLRDIYMAIYKEPTQLYMISKIDNTTVIANALVQNNYLVAGTEPSFNLDGNKFVKNCILAHASSPSVSSKGASAAAAASANPNNFDDIYTSLTSGVSYGRDEKTGELFKVDTDGKTKIPVTDAELAASLNEPGCGTGVKGIDCRNVSECILSGSPDKLARCLKLQDKDMFVVGQKEVEKMHPKVALQLLKTFGFNPRKEIPSGLVLPPSFDEWIKKVLPKAVNQKTYTDITNNRPLMEYLKGVVSIVRSNPAILVQNNKSSSSGDSSDYARKAGIKRFVAPVKLGDRASLNMSILEQGILTSTPRISGLPLSGLLGNVGKWNNMPVLLGSGVQKGGANSIEYTNARSLKNMFDVLYAEMARNGHELVGADKDRITNMVKKVSHLEEQLFRIMEDLKLFNKLKGTLSIGHGPVGVEEVSLTEVVNAKSTAALMGNTVDNLMNSASVNINEQSQIMHDSIFKIQKALLDVLLRGSSDLIERN